MNLVVPLTVSMLVGACVLYRFWCGLPDRWKALPFFLCAALLLGLSINSCTCFMSLALCKGSRLALIVTEVATLAAAVVILLLARPRLSTAKETAPPVKPAQAERWRIVSWLIGGAIFAAACVFVGQSWSAQRAVTLIYPHGDFDAWQFWNLRARFIYRELAVHQRQFGGAMNPVSHALNLPITVMRAWFYAGGDSPQVAANHSVLFGLLTPITLFSALTWLRSPSTGALAAILVLSAPGFSVNAATQLADVPFTLLTLVAITFLAAARTRPRQSSLPHYFGGLAAGAAAWTKNEGLLLCLAILLAYSVCCVRRSRRAEGLQNILKVVSGMLGMPIFVFGFKFLFAGRGSPIASAGIAENWHRICDPTRWRIICDILQSTLDRTLDMELLPYIAAYAVFILPAGARSSLPVAKVRWTGGLFAAITVGLMTAGYLGVYLLTPGDLSALVNGTLCRLLLQLWPLALLAALLMAPSIDEALERVFAPKAPRTSSPGEQDRLCRASRAARPAARRISR